MGRSIESIFMNTKDSMHVPLNAAPENRDIDKIICLSLSKEKAKLVSIHTYCMSTESLMNTEN